MIGGIHIRMAIHKYSSRIFYVPTEWHFDCIYLRFILVCIDKHSHIYLRKKIHSLIINKYYSL